VFESARLFRPQSQKAFCAPLCTSDLNALDSHDGATEPAGRLPRTMVFTASVSGCDLLFVDEGLWPGLNDAVVIAESGAGRNRRGLRDDARSGPAAPFLYGTKAPLSERNAQTRDAVDCLPEQSRCGQLSNRDIHVEWPCDAHPPLAGKLDRVGRWGRDCELRGHSAGSRRHAFH